jgi:hypothetical protein
MKPLAFRRDDVDLHKALMQAANDYLMVRHDHRFADKWMIAKLVLLVLLCTGFYCLSLTQAAEWIYFGCYFCFIFTAMLITVNVVHDASHNAFFKQRRANRWLNCLVSIPLGLDRIVGECGTLFFITDTITFRAMTSISNQTGFYARPLSSAGSPLCAYSVFTGRWSRP